MRLGETTLRRRSPIADKDSDFLRSRHPDLWVAACCELSHSPYRRMALSIRSSARAEERNWRATRSKQCMRHWSEVVHGLTHAAILEFYHALMRLLRYFIATTVGSRSKEAFCYFPHGQAPERKMPIRSSMLAPAFSIISSANPSIFYQALGGHGADRQRGSSVPSCSGSGRGAADAGDAQLLTALHASRGVHVGVCWLRCCFRRCCGEPKVGC